MTFLIPPCVSFLLLPRLITTGWADCNNTHLLSHSCVDQESGELRWVLQPRFPRLRSSCGGAELLPGGSEGESLSKLIKAADRIQLFGLQDWGLCVSLSTRSLSRPLKATWTPQRGAPSILKLATSPWVPLMPWLSLTSSAASFHPPAAESSLLLRGYGIRLGTLG